MSKIWKQMELNKASETKHIVDTFINYKSDKQVLVSVNSLWVGYHHWCRIKYILKNINLLIYEDEIVSILGANGAGKTTLVNAMTGIIKSQKGEVILNKQQLSLDEFIGIQFQDLKFPQGLSVKNMIDFQVNLLDKKISSALLKTMLETFKLSALLNKVVNKLSGGQQQRLNVLLALLAKPKILILDEFTTGLDITSKKEITNFIHDFSKTNKISVVLISHDIDTIRFMSERFIVLANNTVVVDASRVDVLNKFNNIDKFLDYYIK